MLVENYKRVKEWCDLQYHKPTDINFSVREFDCIKWPNARSKNFFMIIKILAENGYCTINEIIDKDGLSQTPKDRKKRHDGYDLVIKGKTGKFKGLIDKMLIQVEDKENWKTKRKNRYKLSIFGMLYVIHLFSEDDVQSVVNLKYDSQMKYKKKSITKYKKKILDVLVENYSDMLPLIFERWDFMVLEFGTLVNFLIYFAHFNENLQKIILVEPTLDVDVIHMHGWKLTDLQPHAELSILLFAWIARQDQQYKSKFAKDKEILKLYKEYIKFLKIKNHIISLKINYKELTLYGKYDKAKKIGKELIEIYGLSADKWIENFDMYPKMRD